MNASAPCHQVSGCSWNHFDEVSEQVPDEVRVTRARFFGVLNTCRALALLALGLACGGCKTSYVLEGTIPRGFRLDPAAGAYVAEPPDFIRDHARQSASGRLTGLVLNNLLSLVQTNVTLSDGPDQFTNHVARAEGLGCRYLFRPAILEWTERATHHSGLRDRVSVRVTLFELPAAEPVHEVLLRGRSRWFRATEEDVVDDLLVGLYRRYIAELTGQGAPAQPTTSGTPEDLFLKPPRPRY